MFIVEDLFLFMRILQMEWRNLLIETILGEVIELNFAEGNFVECNSY